MWSIELLKDGEGFTISLNHVSCSVKSMFKFNREEADKIFDGWVNDMKKLGYR